MRACCVRSSSRRSWPIRSACDAFGVGEHHRADFAISAPEVVLAAIASRTSRIRLGSAVTVLSTDDPVRVFQRFSTLDALSNGRAEVILGRGSFTESYPLFGFDLARYDELFEDRLGAVRRDPQGRRGDVEGHHADADRRHGNPSADRNGHAQDVDWRRRQPGFRAPRRASRPAADPGHHRRRPAALPALRRPLSPRPRAVRPGRCCRSRRIRRATSRRRTTRPATSSGRTTRR